MSFYSFQWIFVYVYVPLFIVYAHCTVVLRDKLIQTKFYVQCIFHSKEKILFCSLKQGLLKENTAFSIFTIMK